MWLPLKIINVTKAALVKKKIGLVNCDYKLIFPHKYTMYEHIFELFLNWGKYFLASNNFCKHWKFKKNSDSLSNDAVRALNQDNKNRQLGHVILHTLDKPCFSIFWYIWLSLHQPSFHVQPSVLNDTISSGSSNCLRHC